LRLHASQTSSQLKLVAVYGDIDSFYLGATMARQQFKLDAMSMAELRQLRDEVQTALSGKIQMERQELQEKLDELERLEIGSVALETGRPDIASNSPRRRKRLSGNGIGAKGKSSLAGRKVEPKYRGPNGETWAGRGQAPRWLTELEASGSSRESFLIQK
jgi:DNA-binding protein H-NS